MTRLMRFMMNGITALLSLLLVAALCTGAVAQTTKHKIPTAAEVAVQKKAVNRKGIMRRTTNTDRRKAATKHADQRATRIRAERKGVK